jgi:hypothetical protein
MADRYQCFRGTLHGVTYHMMAILRKLLLHLIRCYTLDRQTDGRHCAVQFVNLRRKPGSILSPNKRNCNKPCHAIMKGWVARFTWAQTTITKSNLSVIKTLYHYLHGPLAYDIQIRITRGSDFIVQEA